jgi:HEAT repeat protein
MKLFSIWIAVTLCVAPHALAQASAQTRTARPTPMATQAGSDAAALATGWAALAAGRAADAERSADSLLIARRSRHDAVNLKIRARLGTGGANIALDAYEEWLRGVGREDVFLIQPIARRALEDFVNSPELALKLAALQALAANGSTEAIQRLTELATSPQPEIGADEALARNGDAQAIGRLEKALARSAPQADVSSTIDALADAKATGAAAAIAKTLVPSRPVPTRMSAAHALGLLGDRDAITTLKQALQDPDPPVRFMAAAALARLGDSSADQMVAQMENSPVGDIRMMIAENSAAVSPSGAWVAIARDVLNDSDPLARLNAARVLLAHGADAADAKSVLDTALSDPNPALRTAAARVLGQLPSAVVGTDIALLRRLLRDTSPQVRFVAADALLRQAGGVD